MVLYNLCYINNVVLMLVSLYVFAGSAKGSFQYWFFLLIYLYSMTIALIDISYTLYFKIYKHFNSRIRLFKIA